MWPLTCCMSNPGDGMSMKSSWETCLWGAKTKREKSECQMVPGGEFMDEERGNEPMTTSLRDRHSMNL